MREFVQQLTAKGCYDEAIDVLTKHIRECPKDDEAYYLRGALYKQLEKWGESMSDLNKAMAINPDSPAATLRQLLQDIVDFRYMDLLNP